MGETSIRVSDEVKRRLELEKQEDESFDDVLKRLPSPDRWHGFCALTDEEQNTREGMRRMRRETRSRFGDDGERSSDIERPEE